MDMRRLLLLAAAIVLIVLGALQFTGGLGQLLGPAGDPDIASGSAKATAAAEAFSVLAKDSAATGMVPRQMDATAKPLLDAIFGVDVVRTKVLTTGDLGAIAAWATAGAKAGNVYIFAGTGTSDPAVAVKDAKAVDQIDRNTVAYAPELGRYMDGQLALQGAMAEVVAADVSGSKSGVDQLRSGIASTMGGVITTLPLAGLDDAWRTARVAALTATAPKVAKLLLPAQCAGLRMAADKAVAAIMNAAVKDQLNGFNAALKC